MENRNLRKTRVGKVVSNKMDKTAVVAIHDNVRHAKYGKIMIERKIEFAEFCKVTDEDGQSNFSTYDYYSTLVTFAFYDLGDKSSAADICFKTLENGGANCKRR